MGRLHLARKGEMIVEDLRTPANRVPIVPISYITAIRRIPARLPARTGVAIYTTSCSLARPVLLQDSRGSPWFWRNPRDRCEWTIGQMIPIATPLLSRAILVRTDSSQRRPFRRLVHFRIAFATVLQARL